MVQSRSLLYSLYGLTASVNVPSNPLPATFLRGGTSKGVFLSSQHLPSNRDEWKPIFLALMGSPDAKYGRQLNGMGGGVSSLSKIVVVSPPSEEAPGSRDVDVEYTFAQVGIQDDVVDYTGNCGNLSSMVGAFALAEHMVHPIIPVKAPGGAVVTVRCFNTNTRKIVHTTFPVSSRSSTDGTRYSPLLNLPQTSIAGVTGSASRIVLDFINPAGARTGALLPTGRPVDTVSPGSGMQPVEVSLVDATNPTVFISSGAVASTLHLLPTTPLSFTDPATLDLLERVRQEGARLMGLSPRAQAQPKIAVLSPPRPWPAQAGSMSSAAEDCDPLAANGAPEEDICVHTLSMGVLHRAVPMTVGLCLGVAAGVPGTVASQILEDSGRRLDGRRNRGMLRIRHPSGVVVVGARFGAGGRVESAQVERTGKMLMTGIVWW